MKQIISLSIPEWLQACQDGAYLTVRIPLAGSSMQPLIRKGRDLVTVAPLTRGVKRGDIVLFHREHDGAWVVHRVYRLQGSTVVTLGDGCLRPDAPMPLSRICGLVTHMERSGSTTASGRTIRLDTGLWRCLGRLWMGTLPLRRPVIRGLHGLKRRLRAWMKHG